MSSNIDLKPDQLNIIRQILKTTLPPNSKIWLFGSRVKGNAKPYSDIDLLIDLGRPLSLQELAVLKLAFDESNLPYKVDIADAATIGTLFKSTIQDQLVVIDL